MLTYSLVQQHRWHQSKGPYRSDIYGTSLLWRTSEGFKAWKLGQLDSQYHGLKLKRKSWVEIQYLIDTQSFLQTIEWKLGIPSQETRSKATDQNSGPWPEGSAGILTWTWALTHRTAEGADGTCLLRLDGSTEPSWLESLDRDCWSKNARLNSAGALTLTWVLLLFEYAQMNLAAEPRHSQGLQYREPPPTQNQEARAAN